MKYPLSSSNRHWPRGASPGRRVSPAALRAVREADATVSQDWEPTAPDNSLPTGEATALWPWWLPRVAA